MGRGGQRHSKNAGTMGAEGLTYGERRALGFGTLKERLGKDSLGNYYDCCLTLQPAVDPVVTPDGHLYSKQAIIENLLAQKKAIKRKLAAWEAAQQEAQRKADEAAAVEAAAELVAFDRSNHMGISDRTATAIKEAIREGASGAPHTVGSVMAIKEQEERAKTLKAFWTPGHVGSAETRVEKPDMDTCCPATGKKLRLKDLIDVKFTPVPEAAESEGRYMDPVTKDVFTNAHRLVVLGPTGHVVLKDTWEKVLKQDGAYNGHKLKDKDIIELKTGGTGFVARDGDKVESKKHFALGAGSGRQDMRGQAAAGPSLGGLRFMN